MVALLEVIPHRAHIHAPLGLVVVAIVTQAASIATGYDMWEEKEIGTPPA
jgi:uncharacterized membrane protein